MHTVVHSLECQFRYLSQFFGNLCRKRTNCWFFNFSLRNGEKTHASWRVNNSVTALDILRAQFAAPKTRFRFSHLTNPTGKLNNASQHCSAAATCNFAGWTTEERERPREKKRKKRNRKERYAGLIYVRLIFRREDPCVSPFVIHARHTRAFEPTGELTRASNGER